MTSAKGRSSPPGLPWGRLVVLAAAVFAAVTTEVLPVALLPQLTEAFHVDEARIGWWMSVFAIVVAAGAIPMTAFLTRFPRRTALVALLLTYAASNAVIVASDGRFWVALAARAVGGLAHAGLFSVVVAAAVSLAPPRLAGRAVAVTNAGATVALTFGVPLGTAAGATLGWQWAFAATTVVLLALAAAAVVVLPAAPGTTGAPAGPSVLAELRGRALQAVALATVVLMLGHYSVYTYVSPILEAAGVAPGSVSLALLGFGVGSLVGLLVAGALADRHAAATLGVAVALVVACCLALAGSTHSASWTTVTVAVWGAAFGGLPTLLQTLALRASTPDAAPAVVNSMFNVGIAVGAWVGGQVLVASGVTTLTLVSAVVVTLGWCLLVLGRSAPGSEAPVGVEP